MTTKMKIDAVAVTDRHRKDMGDLTALADSIATLGLLHPIVLTPTGRLIAGQRRLEACKLLGWTEIPAVTVAHINDARSILTAERDENTCRKDMTPSEKVAVGMAIEELEKPSAAERKAHGMTVPGRKKNAPGTVTGSVPKDFGDVRDIVGAAVGLSGAQYYRAKTVTQAAEGYTESRGKTKPVTPEAQRVAMEAVKEMDATGEVAAAYSKVAPLVGRKPLMSGGHVEVPAAPEPQTDREKMRAAAHRRRLEAALSGIAGMCDGIDGINLSWAIGTMTPGERDGWATKANQAGKSLLALQRILKA